MIEFDCDGVNKFIEAIYDFLSDEKICFLSGSIVTDDDSGKLFNSLYKGKQELKCKNTRDSRRVGSISGGTHASFINDKRFKLARQSQSFSTNDIMLKSTGNIQYEKILDPKLTHMCKKSCAVKACHKSENFPKGVILFYQFKIIDTKLNIHKKFLFMKLEEFSYNDLAHMGKAWDRYVLKKEKKDSYLKKREDPGKGKYNYEMVEKDKWAMIEFVRLYGDEQLVFKVHEKINFYNDNVRVGNEMYIPSELILLLHITTESEDEIRTAQVFGKHLQKSGKEKIESMCLTNTWSKDQLYFMSKVLKLPVSKNMTKIQLCDYLIHGKHEKHIGILKSFRKHKKEREIVDTPSKLFVKHRLIESWI